MRQIAVPTDVRALSTLPSVDYEDAFLVETRVERTGEEWARATLEAAPRDTRRALRCGWSALGLRLGSTRDERLVLGWQVRPSTPDVALLGADSPLGRSGLPSRPGIDTSSEACSSKSLIAAQSDNMKRLALISRDFS